LSIPWNRSLKWAPNILSIPWNCSLKWAPNIFKDEALVEGQQVC